jgi:phosphotransferase system enzyme I (PtsP)
MNMLTTLQRIVQEVNRIPGLEHALQYLVTTIKATMNVDSCSIYLSNYEYQHHVLTATDGLSPDAVGTVCIGFSEGLIGLVGQREEPLNIQDAHRHPRFAQYPEVKEDNYNAFLGVPIIHQRRVLGILTMQQAAERRFSADEEAFLVTLATQVALEIANANMLGDLILSETEAVPSGTKVINGVPGSTGLGLGVGFIPTLSADLEKVINRRSGDTDTQIQAYRAAVKQTREEVAGLSKNLDASLPEDVKAIFVLYDQLLDANSLGREVESQIKMGWDAATGLKLVIQDYASRFRAMDDPYMQERAVDIIDLSNRILRHIQATDVNTYLPDSDIILVAEEISAPLLAEYPAEQLKGIITTKGSQNSHAAILARAMGVPAVMGVNSILPNLLKGKTLFVDGYAGSITVAPSETQIQTFSTLIHEENELLAKIDAQKTAPTVTKDHHPMSLLVNAGLAVERELSDNQNITGVGLFRTEIPFMMRERFPSEEEQFELYRSILQANPEKPITMRTLDVGGDKPLPYFPIVEENPFLGWRGIRLTLDQPEIFLVQARAMIRASEDLTNLQILLPMISSVNEVKEAKRLLKQAFYEVKEESNANRTTLMMPQVGVMIEVPAAVHIMAHLAKYVDFFSVGTNDLTQYLLAVDRNNPRVASIYTGYHPAVLQVLQHIAKQAELLNKPITVCGELAGDPAGAILLMAMGYDKLSMNAYNIRKINWVIRSIQLYSAQHLLSEVMYLSDPQAIKQQIDQYLEAHQLGGLVRAGG